MITLVPHHLLPGELEHALRATLACGALLLLSMPGWANPMSQAQLDEIMQRVGEAAAWEIEQRGIPSIAIGLTTRDGKTAANAWGHTDGAKTRPASTRDVYRAGSITKLLTDIVVMQLVEQGKLELDTPVQRYLPEFQPRNPHGGQITLRQLMAHRSGLIREPPRGSYFDAHSQGQADAVASLNETTLVAAPGTLTKYSNAAIGVVGELIARVTGKPYEQLISESVLQPLGTTASQLDRAKLSVEPAYAEMASFDGPRFAAPRFELGMPAAGSLYSTVGDLGRVIHMTLNRGATAHGRLLEASTFEAMWQPQYPIGGERRYGLGFSVAALDGHRMVGHGGEIYGYAAQILILPDDDVGVIVFSTVDSGPTAKRLGDFTLRTALVAMNGGGQPIYFRTQRVSAAEAAAIAGRYVEGADSLVARIFNDRLVVESASRAGEVRRLGERYYIDDVQSFADTLDIAPDRTWISLDGRRYRRATPGAKPLAPPADFAELIGEYGWEHNFIRIYQRDGKPYARFEWVDYAPLRRVDANTYAIASDDSLYMRESLRIERDRQGAVRAVSLSGIRFPRRDFGAETMNAIQAGVKAERATLRATAMKATPPDESAAAKVSSDLVAIQAIDPRIRLDIRYATTDNFLGIPVYDKPAAYAQRPVAVALARANHVLHRQGYGLLIHDSYRPWFVTKQFWDATPPASRVFVADPTAGSRHNRGAAVDLTLFELATGKAVAMTGRYDEFSSRSYSNYIGGTDQQRWLRELLRTAMEQQGFDVYPQEWWHFDFNGWERYRIHNESFEALETQAR